MANIDLEEKGITEDQKWFIYNNFQTYGNAAEIAGNFNIKEEDVLAIVSEMEEKKNANDSNVAAEKKAKTPKKEKQNKNDNTVEEIATPTPEVTENITYENETDVPEDSSSSKKQKVKNSTILPIILFIAGLGLCAWILHLFPINNSGKFYQVIFYGFLAVAVLLFVFFIVAFSNAQRFYKKMFTTSYSDLFAKQRSGLRAAWKAYEKTLIDWIVRDKNDNEICTKRTRTNSDLYFDGEHWVSYSFTKIPIESLLRIVPGTLIGMGILGTFIGFADGVSGLGNVSEKTSEELMQGIGFLTDGLTIAFNTSIVGVIMSVIVNFLMFNPLKNACDMLCQKICDRIDEEFYISDYDALHKDLDGVSDAIKHQFVENTKDLALEVRKAVTETVEDNIDRLQTVIDSQIEQLQKAMEVTETIPAKVEQSFVNTKEFIQATLDESREKFVSELNSTVNSLTGCIEAFDAVPGKIETAFENSKQFIQSTLDESREKYMVEINKTTDAVNGCVQALNENQEKLRQSNALFAEQVQNVINRFSATSDDISNHFKDTADSFTQNFGQAATTATENFKNLSTAIAQNFAKIVDQTNLTFDKIQDFAGFYEEANKVTENLNNILSQMQAYNAQTQAGYDSVLNSLTAITEESNATLKEFKNLDSTLSSTIGTITKNLETYNETVANALQNYLGQFADKSSNFANGLNSSVQSLEMSASSLADLSQDLTKSVQEFTVRNEKLMTELKNMNSSK